MPHPIDYKYIEMTEKELGVIFPPLFKEKMMEENGGRFVMPDGEEWYFYPFFDKSSKKRMAKTCVGNIAYETKRAREGWGNAFPSDAIVVGTNGGGDELVLLPITKEPKGFLKTIYYWIFVISWVLDSKILSETLYAWRHETGEVEALGIIHR